MAWSTDGRSVYRYFRYCGKEFIRSLKSNNSADVVFNNTGEEPFEKGYQEKEDPWDYQLKPYEQAKYRQTLDILPPARFQSGMELACAEGVFSAQLASRVDRLVGADISPSALERAKKRCKAYGHVSFQQLDLRKDPLPGLFDLIVCSEVLYFMGGRDGLAEVAHKLVAGLRPGGKLVMAHMNIVRDDPSKPGFDWKLEFGARVIEEVFQKTFPLRLERRSYIHCTVFISSSGRVLYPISSILKSLRSRNTQNSRRYCLLISRRMFSGVTREPKKTTSRAYRIDEDLFSSHRSRIEVASNPSIIRLS